jgi:hypothetical protein
MLSHLKPYQFVKSFAIDSEGPVVEYSHETRAPEFEIRSDNNFFGGDERSCEAGGGGSTFFLHVNEPEKTGGAQRTVV